MRDLAARAVAAGRVGRTRSFVLALVVALLVMPSVEALAYFAATGSGSVTNVQAGTASSVVSIARNTGNPITYAGPSTTNLMPSGTVSFRLQFACTSGCPAQVSTVSLASWSSNKTGCDSTTLPNSFTMTPHTVNLSIPSASPVSDSTDVTITWANLAVDQSACSGAIFTFNLTTP